MDSFGKRETQNWIMTEGEEDWKGRGGEVIAGQKGRERLEKGGRRERITREGRRQKLESGERGEGEWLEREG